MRRLIRTTLTIAMVAALAAIIAPRALASSTASLQPLDQSYGTSANVDHDLGLNLSFSNTGTDSPRTLVLQLPAGLLADAALEGGACLRTAASNSPSSGCLVGTASVVAQPDVEIPGSGLLGLGGGGTTPTPVTEQVSFYLVAPPASGDLGGLEVYSSTLGQLGTTGAIVIRPTGSAAGVGATISLTLPDTLELTLPVLGTGQVPISIESIDSTLDNLRYPATCPSSPAPFVVQATGYGSGDATQTLSQPLSVTGCSSLPFQPSLSVTAARDAGDDAVALTTVVTEPAADAPSRSTSLSFPTSVFAPGLGSLERLCLGSTSGCTPVGEVMATSPLYPTTLTGTAYLTGTSAGLSLTLVFPSPFPLTLVGPVNLLTNTASFTGLPDIPLSNLTVALYSGPRGLFDTGCQVRSGTATGNLVAQNGSPGASITAPFTVTGCPGSSSGSGASGGSGSGGSGSGGSGSGSGSSGSSSGGSGSGSGGSWSSSSSGSHAASHGTSLQAQSIRGLSRRRPWMRFAVSVARHWAGMRELTVALPHGLAFRSLRVHHRLVVHGVSVRGAKVRSIALRDHHLVITLRRSARHMVVTFGTRSLNESRALELTARRGAHQHLHLRVIVRDTRHHTRTLTVTPRLTRS